MPGPKNSKRESRSRKEAAPPAPRQRIARMSEGGKLYIDYKETETLRKLCSSNGKIGSRKRTGASALEQRMLAKAVKQARYMALSSYQASAQ